uniref:AlNc14C1017G12716 protein n=1 Tax=Albugo laibachii Nc14 TaxID=890382 RepID=F0X2F1_9STRA|nr:AlNc14C1017G12716 [Albugo laibachii Nc14]|eukprot:CCA28041.1 AlNc14C1017G12716 [Albugo laibachii Nc14]
MSMMIATRMYSSGIDVNKYDESIVDTELLTEKIKDSGNKVYYIILYLTLL